MQVIWWDGAKGNWDSGLLASIFEKNPETFAEHNSKQLPFNGSLYPEKAIVIVVGRPEVAPLRTYLDNLKSGLVILTSEEDAYFDWKAAIPTHLEIWTQYYSPSKEGIKTRLLLGAPNRLKDFKINSHLPKKYLWSFVGQVQNPSRQKCVEVLKGLPGGFLHIADGFGGVNGLNYQDYLDVLCESKFVICPAGSMCVDSFRFYEAIECGAVPITEPRAPRDKPDFNYWNECGVSDDDIMWMDNWDYLNVIQHPKTTFEYEQQKISNWWDLYKSKLETNLLTYATN